MRTYSCADLSCALSFIFCRILLVYNLLLHRKDGNLLMVILTPNNGKTVYRGKVMPKTVVAGQNSKFVAKRLLPCSFSIGDAWRYLQRQHHLKKGSYRGQKSQK